MEFRRRRERERECVDVIECLRVVRRDGAVGVTEQDGVVAAGAQHQEIDEPDIERRFVRHIPSFNGPF